MIYVTHVYHPLEPAAELAKQTRTGISRRNATIPNVTEALRNARDLVLVANRRQPESAWRFRLRRRRLAQAKINAKPTS
jgi:hypothetical protein